MFKRALKQEPLTPLQRDCLGVIAEYIVDLSRSPTHKEICAELDLKSRSGVNRVVQILTAKGWLHPRRRGIRYALVPTVDSIAFPLEGPVALTTAGRSFIEAKGIVRG